MRKLNKNPANNDGWTPIHTAAINSNLEICRLIVNNVDNKHPINNEGKTPKNTTDEKNYTSVSQLF